MNAAGGGIGRLPVTEPTELGWDTVTARHPALKLLLLLGSRASGQAHPASDWDLGVLGDAGLDLLGVRADLSELLAIDAVDVVDLRTASAVLRRDAAVAGRVLVERDGGWFADFQIEAVSFWADVEPVVREAHRDVLRAVGG